MENIVVKYFEELFKEGQGKENLELIYQDIATSKVTTNQALEMDKMFSKEELTKALKDMHSSKAPSLDGFHVVFY